MTRNENDRNFFGGILESATEEMPTVESYSKDAVRVTLVLILLIVVVRCVQPIFSGPSSQYTLGKAFIEQANHFYTMSKQDRNLVYALQHANYAISYLHAARHCVNDTVLERVSGVDVHDLQRVSSERQRSLLSSIKKDCATIRNNNSADSKPIAINIPLSQRK